MINKRLLIKNLLAHNDENSFYDKKRKIDIGQKEGKAKFLKHICASSAISPAHSSNARAERTRASLPSANPSAR